MTARKVVLIAENIRSAQNVGSLLRTADGLGVSKVYLCGYTPYPVRANDDRLPHEADAVNRRINKTSLGAENFVDWQYVNSAEDIIFKMRDDGYEIIALEQTAESISIKNYKPTDKVSLVVGNEVTGVSNSLLMMVDKAIEIPMKGQKESLNVAVAAAIAIYDLCS